MSGLDRPMERLSHRLRLGRLDRFVGRAAEIELVQSALESDNPQFSVLFLCGPGGVGKSALLDAVADRADRAGAHVVRLDGHDVRSSAEAVESALATSLQLSEPNGPIDSHHGRIVLLIDSYEHLRPLDDWVRERLIPRLPQTALVVIAGRSAPGPVWRTDPAWHGLMRVVSLRNLTSEESREFLHAAVCRPNHTTGSSR